MGHNGDMGIEVEYQIFSDVDEHAEALHGWNQRYQQISAGSFRSALTQLTLDDLALFREEFSQRVTQQGVAPSGPVVTFAAIVNSAPSPPIWFQGHPLGAHDFLCVSGDTEFALHLPPNAKILGVTLKQSQWESLIPEEMHATFRQLIRRQRMTVGQRDYVSLCSLIERSISQQIADTSANAPTPVEFSSLERIPAFIASLVAGAKVDDKNNLTQVVHADIVKRCCKIAMQPSETPVTVADLCAALKISPRTLQNSFMAVTGTSPASYLRSVRLAEVRKLLNSTERSSVSVGDAAARWGFTTSHFAATYQRQYGELPSTTSTKKNKF